MLSIVVNQVKDIPCGTKGGVMISFDKIEVQYCSSFGDSVFQILSACF
jgi:hypothetical protein